MHFTYGLLILVFVIALMANPTLGDGWYWELGNGLGFVCFAALLYLTLEGRSVGGGRLPYHRLIGYLALLTLMAHSLWFLLGDPIVFEYLKPGSSVYMVLGIFALLLCLVLVLTSIINARQKVYHGHAAFKLWHRYMAISLLFMSAVHIALSGFYFDNILQIGLLAALVLAVVFAPLVPNSEYLQHVQIRPQTKRVWLKLSFFSFLVVAVFVIIRIGFGE